MFTRVPQPPIVHFEPDPDADAAHGWLLVRFQAAGHPFGDHPYTNSLKGNIGEAVAHVIGDAHDFINWRCEMANAHDPFSAISRPGVDLLWILDGANLLVALQEVKASSDAQLSVADSLLHDYSRLFGDDVRLTFHTRLQAAAYRLEYLSHQIDLAERLRDIGGISPATCVGIDIVPTLIHSAQHAEASKKLLAIRTTLVGDGWPTVTPWSISLPDLDKRLQLLCRGQ